MDHYHTFFDAAEIQVVTYLGVTNLQLSFREYLKENIFHEPEELQMM